MNPWPSLIGGVVAVAVGIAVELGLASGDVPNVWGVERFAFAMIGGGALLVVIGVMLLVRKK